MTDRRLVILSGPSCVGKSPLAKFYPKLRKTLQPLVLTTVVTPDRGGGWSQLPFLLPPASRAAKSEPSFPGYGCPRRNLRRALLHSGLSLDPNSLQAERAGFRQWRQVFADFVDKLSIGVVELDAQTIRRQGHDTKAQL